MEGPTQGMSFVKIFDKNDCFFCFFDIFVFGEGCPDGFSAEVECASEAVLFVRCFERVAVPVSVVFNEPLSFSLSLSSNRVDVPWDGCFSILSEAVAVSAVGEVVGESAVASGDEVGSC